MFVEDELAGDKCTRRIQTEVLIFINKAPIHWYSKMYATSEKNTFGSELCAMKAGVEMVEDLHYKLRMFGISIDGSVNVFCDNEAVYKNNTKP